MAAVVIYCPFTSPRLTYVLDWIFNEQFQCGYILTDNAADKTACTLSYGAAISGAILTPDAGLLPQTNIEVQNIKTGTWNGVPVLFYKNESDYSLPFDIFSAIFYLLSRYEEYLPFTPDKHNRYPATESILYKMGCLERPLVDEWLLRLQQLLAQKNIEITKTAFSYLPTYDIDIAYSYSYKGFTHTIGGYIKDLAKGNMNRVKERTSSLKGEQDPFDSFDWLFDLHGKYTVRPIYFILSALNTTAFDKNIHPAHPAMKRLIKRLSADGDIGLHPSYYSNRDTELIFSEKKTLVSVAGRPVNISRQHYIKNKIPYTYNLLQAKTILEDYSMGYATHLGFRAGTGRSFPWYNLDKERTTTFKVHPFCFMDTAARFECGLNAETAFQRLDAMKQILQKCDSKLVTVFHNFSLGTDAGWAGWSHAYEQFFETVFTS